MDKRIFANLDFNRFFFAYHYRQQVHLIYSQCNCETFVAISWWRNMLVCYKHIDGTFPGKQVINNAQEIIIPKVQAWWQNQNVSKYFDSGHISSFMNYCWLWLWTKLRQRQISASWTKNKRRRLLANQPRLLPGGQRGPVPGVP